MTGVDWLALGLIVAIWRVTRLLVVDEFPPVRAVRDWFIKTFAVVDADGNMIGGRHLGGIGHAVAYVWTCQWCMSIWAGAGVVWLADWRLDVTYPWLVVAAGSCLTGVMSWLEQEHDQRWRRAEAEWERVQR